MTPIELQDHHARAAFGSLNCPPHLLAVNAAYVAPLLGSDGVTAFPMDAEGNRRYRPDPLGSGRAIPVTVAAFILELLGDRRTYQPIAWMPYGYAYIEHD